MLSSANNYRAYYKQKVIWGLGGGVITATLQILVFCGDCTFFLKNVMFSVSEFLRGGLMPYLQALIVGKRFTVYCVFRTVQKTIKKHRSCIFLCHAQLKGFAYQSNLDGAESFILSVLRKSSRIF